MSNYIQKLETAKSLILEVEEDMIQSQKSCPYEIGFTLRKLDEALEKIKDMKKE